MTRLHENACIVGGSPLTALLRRLLQAADSQRNICWGIDEMYTLGDWPAGAHEHFVAMGVLKEIEPSGLVWMWECVEPDWVEPVWLPDAQHDGRIMGFYSCGSKWCGVHVVENDRRRQWAPNLGGIAAAVARAVGGTAKEIVHQRIWYVGTAKQGGDRELFLLRGGAWPDAAAAMSRAGRMIRSSAPALLVFNDLPPETAWSGRQVPVLVLSESATVQKDALGLDLSPLDAQLCAGATVGAANWLTVTEAAELLMRDLPGLNLVTARARVSVGASRSAFRTNGLKRERRRIEFTSFGAWRLSQRDKDLDAEEDDQ